MLGRNWAMKDGDGTLYCKLLFSAFNAHGIWSQKYEVQFCETLPNFPKNTSEC